jgi:poly [ADP-ribose] polymerase
MISLNLQAGGEVPHPLDLNYELLKADLSVVDRSSDEYKVIERNLRSTSYSNLNIIDVWRVDRNGVVRDETTSSTVLPQVYTGW